MSEKCPVCKGENEKEVRMLLDGEEYEYVPCPECQPAKYKGFMKWIAEGMPGRRNLRQTGAGEAE